MPSALLDGALQATVREPTAGVTELMAGAPGRVGVVAVRSCPPNSAAVAVPSPSMSAFRAGYWLDVPKSQLSEVQSE